MTSREKPIGERGSKVPPRSEGRLGYLYDGGNATPETEHQKWWRQLGMNHAVADTQANPGTQKPTREELEKAVKLVRRKPQIGK